MGVRACRGVACLLNTLAGPGLAVWLSVSVLVALVFSAGEIRRFRRRTYRQERLDGGTVFTLLFTPALGAALLTVVFANTTYFCDFGAAPAIILPVPTYLAVFIVGVVLLVLDQRRPIEPEKQAEY